MALACDLRVVMGRGGVREDLVSKEGPEKEFWVQEGERRRAEVKALPLTVPFSLSQNESSSTIL